MIRIDSHRHGYPEYNQGGLNEAEANQSNAGVYPRIETSSSVQSILLHTKYHVAWMEKVEEGRGSRYEKVVKCIDFFGGGISRILPSLLPLYRQQYLLARLQQAVTPTIMLTIALCFRAIHISHFKLNDRSRSQHQAQGCDNM